MLSGTATCSIVWRKMLLTLPSAPAPASITQAITIAAIFARVGETAPKPPGDMASSTAPKPAMKPP